MPSVWIRTRPTKGGGVRHRVEFRAGGREAPTLFGGSFENLRLARARRMFILGELATGRMPELLVAPSEPLRAPTFISAQLRNVCLVLEERPDSIRGPAKRRIYDRNWAGTLDYHQTFNREALAVLQQTRWHGLVKRTQFWKKD